VGRKPKFSKEVKIEACERYINGHGSFESIAKEVGCNRERLRQWYLKYRIHGPMAFDPNKTNRTYRKEFKLSVVESYLSGKYSFPDLGAKHNIAEGVVWQWVNKYNGGIELKTYDPKSEVYTMKSRRTSYEERLEIVNWVISNDMNYKEAASKFQIRYALVYKWTKDYQKEGAEALRYKKRGPKAKSIIDESSFSEVERLKLALEREQALRKRAEFELEVLKKKEEFERKNRYRK
jgi:transposase-like protein